MTDPSGPVRPTSPPAGPAPPGVLGHAAERPGPDGRFGGLSVPDPGFAGDEGAADPSVRVALAAWANGSGSTRSVVAALSGARLLVPVVAVLDTETVGAGGHRHEKDSHMATVTLVGADGRRGLLAFTGVDALAAWDPQARPVPVLAALAARAALDEAADALLVDVAGPHRAAIGGPALLALAGGGAWPPVAEDPVVAGAVAAVALAVPGVRRVRLEPAGVTTTGGGDGVDALVRVDLLAGTDSAAVTAEVGRRLAAHPALRERLVDRLAVVAG